MRKFKLNSKTILIGVVLLGLIIAALSLVSQQKPKNEPASSLSDKLTISDVSVRNFEADRVAKNDSDDSLIVDNDDYQIVYVKKYNQFYITIYSSDFEATKQRAEGEFLATLEVSKEDACKLKIFISSPSFANSSAPTENSLSFCKNGN